MQKGEKATRNVLVVSICIELEMEKAVFCGTFYPATDNSLILAAAKLTFLEKNGKNFLFNSYMYKSSGEIDQQMNCVV